MTFVMLEIDGELAAHLAVAMRIHRKAVEANRQLRLPAGWHDVEDAVIRAHRAATAGQNRTEADTYEGVVVTESYGRRNDLEILNHVQAASVLGVSARTVRRMLDRGEIAGVGSRRRIPRRELERLTGVGRASGARAISPGPRAGETPGSRRPGVSPTRTVREV